MRKNNNYSGIDSVKVVLSITTIFFASLAVVFSYTTFSGSKIDNHKLIAPYVSQINKDNRTIKNLKDDNSALKTQLEDQKNQTPNLDQGQDKNLFLEGYQDLSTKFVSNIIGPKTASEIRKNLNGVGTKEVIDKVAPVDENEKFDSKVPQSNIIVSQVDSYIDNSSITDQSAKVYAIAHYKIDDKAMTTRLNLTLGLTDQKSLIVTDASYDTLNNNSED